MKNKKIVFIDFESINCSHLKIIDSTIKNGTDYPFCFALGSPTGDYKIYIIDNPSILNQDFIKEKLYEFTKCENLEEIDFFAWNNTQENAIFTKCNINASISDLQSYLLEKSGLLHIENISSLHNSYNKKQLNFFFDNEVDKYWITTKMLINWYVIDKKVSGKICKNSHKSNYISSLAGLMINYKQELLDLKTFIEYDYNIDNIVDELLIYQKSEIKNLIFLYNNIEFFKEKMIEE